VPVASPICRDLAINGGGLTAVGVAGLVASAALVDGGPARAIIPFIIVALVFGLAQVVVSGGWLQKAVVDAPDAPANLQVEPDGVAMRRALLPTIIAIVLIAVTLLAWVQFAALLAGVAFAAGMTDLRARAWVRRREAADDLTVMRAPAPLPFSTARKQVWLQRGADAA
jgi:hypothetical protein